MPKTKEKLYKMKEACALLGVHPNTIRRWDKEGKIRVVRQKGGHRRIPESEINRIFETPFVARPAPSKPATKEGSLSCFLDYVFSYHLDDWGLVRKAVLIRDDYTCQECGRKELLGVHHKNGTQRNDPDNLITLCQKCHSEAHRRELRAPKIDYLESKTPQAVALEPEVPTEGRLAPEVKKPEKIAPPEELPRHRILDELAPTGLAQRTAFGDLISAAVVLKNFTPEELASQAHCPENVVKEFCEKMSAHNYLISENKAFKLHVRLAR